MGLGERVLLFAHPRSGSSSLLRVLQAHPDLRILEEPFNENFIRWDPENTDYRSRIHDAPSLDAVLDEIFAVHNGVKVLEYQLGDELNRHLLMREDLRVVFLRRRNLLQAVVSLRIAEQTRLWKMWELERPLQEYYAALKPLEVGRIAAYLPVLARSLELADGWLQERGSGVLRLVYEDLYYAPTDERARQIEALWAFLGLPPLAVGEVEYFLDPSEQKINSVEMYRFVPNAMEIDEACGGPSVGWLFASPQDSGLAGS